MKIKEVVRIVIASVRLIVIVIAIFIISISITTPVTAILITLTINIITITTTTPTASHSNTSYWNYSITPSKSTITEVIKGETAQRAYSVKKKISIKRGVLIFLFVYFNPFICLFICWFMSCYDCVGLGWLVGLFIIEWDELLVDWWVGLILLIEVINLSVYSTLPNCF